VNSHISRSLVVIFLLALGATCHPLVAQQPSESAQPGSPGASAVSSTGRTTQRNAEVPYSGDEITVSTQTLADGTTLTHKFLTRVYRDSQGRARRERYKSGIETVGEGVSPEYIQISDPVAWAYYSLDPRDLTATKMEMWRPSRAAPHKAAGDSAKPTPAPQPQTLLEDLGTQVIEGLEAHGERVTRTTPEGEQGNDRPMHSIYETWRAVTAPHIVLMMTTKDPVRGETAMHLTNLVLEEPPAELFQVPANYSVKELQPVTKPESPSE